MAAVTQLRTIHRSFAGGEMSPQMRGRFDDVRAQTGCRSLRNFEASPRGPAIKRRGFAHVGFTKDSDKTVLLPFRFSGDQNLIVAVGPGWFRFYAQSAPILFAQLRTVESIDTGTDEIRFEAPHGFAPSEQVRVLALDPGGAEPAPLDDATAYSVVVIDAWTIQLSGQNLTDAGTGTIRVVPEAQMPRTYVSSKTAIGVHLGNNEFTFGIAHGLVTGDPILFTGPGSVSMTPFWAIVTSPTTIKIAATLALALLGTAIDLVGVPVTMSAGTNLVARAEPHGLAENEQISFGTIPLQPNLTEGVTYYAVNTASFGVNEFQVAATPSGPPIVLATETGVFMARAAPRMHFIYEVADQVYVRSVGKGFHTCIQRDPRENAPPATTHWYRQSDDGEIELGNPYAAADLAALDFSQSKDVLRITHGSYDPANLTRVSATQWRYEVMPFTPPLAPPEGLAVGVTEGHYYKITSVVFGVPGLRIELDVGIDALKQGFVDGAYVRIVTDEDHNVSGTLSGDFVVANPGVGSAPRVFELLSIDNSSLVLSADYNASATFTAGTVRFIASPFADFDNYYRVTAIDARGVESEPSDAVLATNNLFQEGAKNTLSWTAVPGAKRYRVYRKVTALGLFGKLGETETPGFVDEGDVAPVADTTPPELDDTLPGSKPQAVTHYDQRLVYGGFDVDPTKIVTSRTAAETDFSLHIPLQADDRLSLNVTLDGSRILHLLAMSEGLLALTVGAAISIEAAGDEVLGAETTRQRTLDRVGAALVMPVVIGGRALFVGALGHHVYEVHPLRRESPVVDLSVRAHHLVDSYRLLQMTATQSPTPMVYHVRNDGRVLALSYQPPEEVLGWSRIDTPGLIESVCAIPDGDSEALYAVVLRGGTRRIERIGADIWLDSSILYDGTNSSAITMQATEGVGWGRADSLVLTASAVVPIEVGDRVQLYVDTVGDDGETVRTSATLEIETIESGLHWRARSTGGVVPEVLRDVALATWSHGRGRLRTHLPSQEVTVVADGGTAFEVDSDADGIVVLPQAAFVIHAGRRFAAELEPLRLSLQQDLAGGHALTWNVSRALLGVAGGEFEIGPSLTQLKTMRAGADDETPIRLPGNWTTDGRLLLRSTDPSPLEVRYLALELAVAGDQ